MKVHVVALLVGSLFVTGWAFPGADVSAADAEETRIEHHVWQGHVACWLQSVGGGGIACGPNTDTTHEFVIQPGLRTIEVDVQWADPERAPPALHATLTKRWENANVGGVSYGGGFIYAEADGHPDLSMRVDAELDGGAHGFQHMTEPWEMRLSVGPGGDETIVADQPFTVHYTLHYGEHAAPWPPVPYQKNLDLNGDLPAGVNVYGNQGCRLFEESIHRFAVTPGLKTVVATVNWRAPQHNMSFNLGTGYDGPYNHAGIAGHFPFETVRGPGPLTLRVDAGPDEPGSALEDLDRERLFFLQLCNGTPNNIIVDMPFSGRYALFYHEHAPDDYVLEADA